MISLGCCLILQKMRLMTSLNKRVVYEIILEHNATELDKNPNTDVYLLYGNLFVKQIIRKHRFRHLLTTKF